MRTTFPNCSQSSDEWHLVDARDLPLGRLAARVAYILLGKNKPTWSPHTSVGDNVIIINAAEVRVSGTKEKTKVYHRHTGHPGGHKKTTFAKLQAENPTRIIEYAVRGMLPKGTLGRKLFSKLKVYPGDCHKHVAQNPKRLDLTVRAR